MAQIILPAQEAIAVLRANVQMPPIIRSLEVTLQGPRVNVKIAPILPMMPILIRLQRYEAPMAQFALDGLPASVNLGALVKLPPGIQAQDGILVINTDTLIRGQLGLKGLRVTGVSWDGAAYRIDAMPG